MVWIAVHIGLVMNERINPWKLGGYAMYTVPPPQSQVHVFTRDGQAWVPGGEGYWVFSFFEANHHNVFRCAAPPEAALRGFLDENAGVRGKAVRLALSEEVMTREPFHIGRVIYATIELAWSGETVTWRHEACGEQSEGRFAYAIG